MLPNPPNLNPKPKQNPYKRYKKIRSETRGKPNKQNQEKKGKRKNRKNQKKTQIRVNLAYIKKHHRRQRQ